MPDAFELRCERQTEEGPDRRGRARYGPSLRQVTQRTQARDV